MKKKQRFVFRYIHFECSRCKCYSLFFPHVTSDKDKIKLTARERSKRSQYVIYIANYKNLRY